VLAIDEATRHEFPISGDEIDDRAGLLGDAARPERLPVDPRMPRVDA
jgi:hypothetical protein